MPSVDVIIPFCNHLSATASCLSSVLENSPERVRALLVDNGSYEVLIEEQGREIRVLLEGKLYIVRVEGKRRQRLLELVTPRTMPKGKLSIRPPMPGMVVSVPVKTGEAVSAGQVLVILESMKMENELRAPQDGVIQAINVTAGDFVIGDQVLLVVERAAQADDESN